MNTYRNNEGTLVSDDEYDAVYVREGYEQGFTDDEIGIINKLRITKMHHGEHITTEDAVRFARAILTQFGKK